MTETINAEENTTHSGYIACLTKKFTIFLNQF